MNNEQTSFYQTSGINGLSREIEISLDGDIDLTDFVNELYVLIDKDCLLEFPIEENDFDAKAAMVVDTIKSIVEKYNEAMTDDDTGNVDSIEEPEAIWEDISW